MHYGFQGTLSLPRTRNGWQGVLDKCSAIVRDEPAEMDRGGQGPGPLGSCAAWPILEDM